MAECNFKFKATFQFILFPVFYVESMDENRG